MPGCLRNTERCSVAGVSEKERKMQGNLRPVQGSDHGNY
jgi:hypothetical protein